jgi:hypothetical protein
MRYMENRQDELTLVKVGNDGRNSGRFLLLDLGLGLESIGLILGLLVLLSKQAAEEAGALATGDGARLALSSLLALLLVGRRAGRRSSTSSGGLTSDRCLALGELGGSVHALLGSGGCSSR